MKNKMILFVLTVVALITPNFVDALTLDEVYAELEKLPLKKVGDKTILETKIVSPDIIASDECVFTLNDYNNRFDKSDGMTSEEWISDETKMCREYLYNDIVLLYLKHLGFEDNDFYLIFNDDDFNKATIYYNYDNTDNENYHDTYNQDIEISYLTNVNMKEVKNAKSILNNFKNDNKLYDLRLINLNYHYGLLEEDDYLNESILARYPNFKKIIEKNPEYEYESFGGRGGGDPLTRARYVQTGVFKDGIMYGVKQLEHVEEQIIFVSKDESGSLKEKVEAKLNEYFNNSIKVQVDVETEYTLAEDFSEEWFNNYVNRLLNTSGIETTGYYSAIKLNDKEFNFVIAEVPSKYITKLYVEAYDVKTDVSVKTYSYDVPADVRVKATDVKNDNKLNEIYDKENLSIESAYDISLIKSFNGTIVNKIDKGVEVYFPVNENYKEGENHKIYYISETTGKKEVYNGVVIKIDNKNYIKFITNHFSTYVLANDKIENPQTLDKINGNIIICLLSIVGLLSSIYFLSRNKEII